MTQHEQGLVAENAALREENEALKAGRCLHEISEPAVNQQLTNAQIDEVFSCLPEGAMGFLKSWGYRQFARKLMSLYAATVQAAPAAVAVPDEREFEEWWPDSPEMNEFLSQNEIDDSGNVQSLFFAAAYIAWKAGRAALAATPATTDEPPFLQRLRTEQRDLSERHQKLSAFIVAPAFQMLTDDDKGLLRKQEAQQHVLLQTLNQRIHGASGKHVREKNNG